MASPIINSSIIRFGLFEVDLEARELRKSGTRIKVQDQPFQILVALLERPGEIVTREELQKRLWSSDTFVDFDLSLNSAVKKLRLALNDDSDNPRFIETLYRRGYRFIGPVSAPAAINNGALQPIIFPAPASDLASEPGLSSTRKLIHRSQVFIFATAIAAILVVAAGFRWFSPAPIQVMGYTQITHDGRFKGGIVTDGQRLYFSEYQGDQITATQVATGGGDTAVIPTPFRHVGVADIAPDGSSLIVANLKNPEPEPSLWLLPLPAGSPRRLTDMSPTAAAASPDGAEFAFARGSEIYLAKNDGSDLRLVGTMKGKIAGSTRDSMVNTLRMSPDGQLLRFTVTDSGTAVQHLWEIRRDGSGLRPLLPDWDTSTFQCCGNWTRDGKYYVFQTSARGKSNVWVLPGKAHWFSPAPKAVQLTNGPLEFGSPVPSKDGKKIFMVGSHPRSELLRLDPKSGWVPYLAGLSAIDLAFSPDGQWVAYVLMPDFTLWRSRVDGSSPLQLTSSSLYAELPRWSPDGQQIAFMGRTDTTRFRAFAVSVNSGDLRELLPGSTIGYDPNWLPDGKSIVLSLSDPLFPAGPGISTVNLSTKEVSPLPGSEPYFSPRPSPDGKFIVAITRNSDRLVLFDVATKKWSDLTTPPFGPVGYPSWSRDGQSLYFDTTFGDDSGVFRIRIADRKLEKVTSLTGLQRFEANFGPWSGLAPDDSPLITRDISNQEIYALDWQAP